MSKAEERKLKMLFPSGEDIRAAYLAPIEYNDKFPPKIDSQIIIGTFRCRRITSVEAQH